MQAAAADAAGQLKGDRDRLRVALDAAEQRLTVDEEHTLRGRLAYLHSERCELLERVNAAEEREAAAMEAGKEAEARCREALSSHVLVSLF